MGYESFVNFKIRKVVRICRLSVTARNSTLHEKMVNLQVSNSKIFLPNIILN